MSDATNPARMGLLRDGEGGGDPRMRALTPLAPAAGDVPCVPPRGTGALHDRLD